ncbi:uncharacterized protein LOC111780739 [Cucurbita pepo subsp. pepo]|uniref:uncharacterized protein LOC111780739 n=1 Tax=Cucurbita pepo subsp. pepo TaxID=3664 RepID=UPI000C9D447A|nr:uncharacterized protein LOC111780739 [Cucurbita pepo subsp. pepo]
MLGRFFQVIGIPWPDLNDGLFYNDVIKPSDSGSLYFRSTSLFTEAISISCLVIASSFRDNLSGKSLIELYFFFFCKYKISAPLEGWLRRIQNEQDLFKSCLSSAAMERIRYSIFARDFIRRRRNDCIK